MHWFEYPLKEFPSNLMNSKKHVYFGVNPVEDVPDDKTKRATDLTVCAMNGFFCDFDFKDTPEDVVYTKLQLLKNSDVFPSVIVFSGGGIHCYWLLNRPYLRGDENFHEVVEVEKRLVDVLESDAAVKDLARILRLPGTINHKYPKECFVLHASGELFALEQIERFVSENESTVEDEQHTSAEWNKDYSGETKAELSQFSLTEKLRFAGEKLQKLSVQRANNYLDWRNVGFALKELGETGFTLFCEFSAKSTNGRFKGASDCLTHWNKWSVTENGITLNSLKVWATEDTATGVNSPIVGESKKTPEHVRASKQWVPEVFAENGLDIFNQPYVKPNFFIEDLFWESQFVLLSGKSMAGKSLWIYDAIMAMISGSYFMPEHMILQDEHEQFIPTGYKSNKTKCLILNYDNAPDLARMRVKAGFKAYDLKPDAMKNFTLINRVSPDSEVGMLDVLNENSLMNFAEYVTQNGIKVILADGLKQLSKMDTNKSDFSLVLDQIQKFVAMTKTCVIAIHHLNKAITGDLQNDISGTSNLSNYCDTALNLYSPDGVNKKIAGAKNRGFRNGDIECYMKYETNTNNRQELVEFRHFRGTSATKVDDYELYKTRVCEILKEGTRGAMELQAMVAATLGDEIGKDRRIGYLKQMEEKKLVTLKKEGNSKYYSLSI